jgi:diguanylate cyclase (GGDEF)-like protein/PAS domain S-box-containing protein
MAPGRRDADVDGTSVSYPRSMSSSNTDDQAVQGVLELARDACAALVAFFLGSNDDLVLVWAPGERPPGLDDGVSDAIIAAREDPSVLLGQVVRPQHEIVDKTGALAVIAQPVRIGGELQGLLGVVDFFAPDETTLDDITSILRTLALRLGADGSLEPEEPSSASESISEASAATATVVTPVPAGAEPFFAKVFDAIADGLLVVRRDGTILYANSALAQIAQRLPEELLGTFVTELLRPFDNRRDSDIRTATEVLFTSSLGRRAELLLPGERELAVEIRGRKVSSPIVGEIYVSLVRDAREVLGSVPPDLEAPLPSVLEEVLETIEDGVIVTDDDARIVVANRAARQLLGLAPDCVGQAFPFSLELWTVEGAPVRMEDHPISHALGGTAVLGEHLVLEDGEDKRHHLLVSARRIPVGSSPGAVLVIREITAQLDQESRLLDLALHDPLTGLANRHLLQDHLARSLRMVRSRGGTLALAYLDLDDFKSINDSYGHDAGDEVLMAVARRLQSTARASDLVARLSGDEFIVVTTAPGTDGAVIDMVIARMSSVLSAPYQIGGRSLAVGVSIGWVVADPKSDDPNTLLVRADEEMYRRKEQGQGRWRSRETGGQR